MNAPIMALAALCDLVRMQNVGVQTHSKAVKPGDIFVVLPKAVPGGNDFDGAQAYLADALQAGAAYAVCPTQLAESLAGALPATATGTLPGPQFVMSDDTRAALGELALARYGQRTKGLELIAVTGTNGKTTETYLLEAVLRAAGRSTGVIGTIEYRWPGHAESSPLTTPGCMQLHAMFAAMREAGADTAIMEVSSHAIEQNRIAGLSFAAALFTNLTQDHLDYHRDMEEYFSVKARLFLDPDQGGLPARGKALAINVDDPYGARLSAMCPGAVPYGFGEGAQGGLAGEVRAQTREGLALRMRYQGASWDLNSPLVGAFNAANLLGAQALGLAMGLDPAHFQALTTFTGVPGRLERISNPQGLAVFVDYAHTPDALVKALAALREARFKRIITVFGCGGNRDKTKRPLMGQAAALASEVVVLTSDNPRHEDPLAIMADVRPGLGQAHKVIEEADRAKAIALALAELQAGDALLIAGKGHENYQVIGDERRPYSDQQTVKELLGCA